MSLQLPCVAGGSLVRGRVARSPKRHAWVRGATHRRQLTVAPLARLFGAFRLSSLQYCEPSFARISWMRPDATIDLSTRMLPNICSPHLPESWSRRALKLSKSSPAVVQQLFEVAPGALIAKSVHVRRLFGRMPHNEPRVTNVDPILPMLAKLRHCSPTLAGFREIVPIWAELGRVVAQFVWPKSGRIWSPGTALNNVEQFLDKRWTASEQLWGNVGAH